MSNFLSFLPHRYAAVPAADLWACALLSLSLYLLLNQQSLHLLLPHPPRLLQHHLLLVLLFEQQRTSSIIRISCHRIHLDWPAYCFSHPKSCARRPLHLHTKTSLSRPSESPLRPALLCSAPAQHSCSGRRVASERAHSLFPCSPQRWSSLTTRKS